MKELSTKEFAIECVNALVGVRYGIRCLNWGVRQWDELELDSVLKYLDVLCEDDSAHWNECWRRFGGDTPLESYDEFRTAFLEAAKKEIEKM